MKENTQLKDILALYSELYNENEKNKKMIKVLEQINESNQLMRNELVEAVRPLIENSWNVSGISTCGGYVPGRVMTELSQEQFTNIHKRL